MTNNIITILLTITVLSFSTHGYAVERTFPTSGTLTEVDTVSPQLTGRQQTQETERTSGRSSRRSRVVFHVPVSVNNLQDEVSAISIKCSYIPERPDQHDIRSDTRTIPVTDGAYEGEVSLNITLTPQVRYSSRFCSLSFVCPSVPQLPGQTVDPRCSADPNANNVMSWNENLTN